MRTLLYLHPVVDDRVDAFLTVMAAAAERYLEHGALSDEVIEVVDGTGRYGLLGLGDLYKLRDGERCFIGVSTFRDADHLEQVMAAVDGDPEIDRLFEQMSTIIDMDRVVRAECETI